jgi:hypothetical protein
MDDLINDQMGVEPSGTGDSQAAPPVESSQASDSVATESQSVATEPGLSQGGQEQSQAAPSQSQPTGPSQTFSVGGRSYTQQELEALATTASQFGHLQNKYTQLLEQQRQQPAVQTQAPIPQGDPNTNFAKAAMARYGDQVKELASKGVIEQDFATLFPGMASQMLAYRDGFLAVSNRLNQLEQGTHQRSQQEQASGLLNEYGRNVQALIQNGGEAFAPLKDQQVLNNFSTYLWNLNPVVNQLRDPNFLAGQWVAFNKDQYLQSRQQQQVLNNKANQARLAMAEASTSTRPPGGFPQEQKSPLDQMVEDFLVRSSS